METKEAYMFTFGTNHVTEDGMSLGSCYVVIEGTYDEARKKMFHLRGEKWSMQYEYGEFNPQDYNMRLVPTDIIGIPKTMQEAI
jgi:hypothetical protein|tara:strand:- start:6441 stop:6692 length:252 start_codon:yes stop_codon:yes gene_type:complete